MLIKLGLDPLKLRIKILSLQNLNFISNLLLFIVLGGALVAEQIVFKVDDAIEDNKKAFQINRILLIVFFALAFILDLLLVILMRTLKKKWQRTSEKNQLKSGTKLLFIIHFSFSFSCI